MPDDPQPSTSAGPSRIREVAGVFLTLGTISFGGPAAHTALMRRELVERRRWLDEDRFLELFGASNVIPGPSSTELGMMIGYLRAGWVGLLVAGACFIAPAMAIVLGLAWAYVRFGSLPQTGWILYGVKPVIIAIVLDALWQLGRRALRSWPLAALGVAVVVLYLLGVDAVALIFGGALLAMLARGARRLAPGANVLLPLLALRPRLPSAEPAALGVLFLAFVKIGAVVFGSGLVLLAFLRADLVEHLHWLSQAQLVDAIAIGQVTPGPVFTTATFIGYLVLGVPGALVATGAIFLPAFVLSGVVYGLLPRLRRSSCVSAFVEGATVCGLGLMAGVTAQLGRVAIVDWLTAGVALIALVILRRFQPNSVWFVLAGGLIGLAARAVGLT